MSQKNLLKAPVGTVWAATFGTLGEPRCLPLFPKSPGFSCCFTADPDLLSGRDDLTPHTGAYLAPEDASSPVDSPSK
jgi:hypothetical protein